MLIADVFKVMLIDNVDKQQFATATLSTAGFEVTSDTKEVEGGGGLVAVLHSPKKENITIQDVRFHFDILAKQLGQPIVTGAGTAWTYPMDYAVESGELVTLGEEPKTPSDLVITDDAGAALALTTDYTISGNVVTIIKAGVNEGDTVTVNGYLYDTSATTQTVIIDNNKYPNGMTVVLETIEIQEDETPVNKVQIIFDQAVFDGSIKFDTQTSRDAVKHDMNLKILNKLGQSIAGKVVRIPIV